MTPDKIAVLVAGIGLIGWVNWYFFRAAAPSVNASEVGGVQEVPITVLGGYDPSEIRVRHGRPVRLVLDRRETNPCSDEIVVADFGIRRFLPPNQKTIVEFTPPAPGRHDFTCGMGMLHGRIIVE